jgi:hypothetical protein
MPGIAPFGILHAYGPDGEHLLGTIAYASGDRVRVAGSSVVAESGATFKHGSHGRVAATYELGGGDHGLESSAYGVTGFVWAE